MNQLVTNIGRRIDVQMAMNEIVREALVWALDHQAEWEKTPCCFKGNCHCNTAQESTLKSLLGYVAASGSRAFVAKVNGR